MAFDLNFQILIVEIDQITFSVDNEITGAVSTGNGYYSRGQFSGKNIWQKGALDAPFDQEVIGFI